MPKSKDLEMILPVKVTEHAFGGQYYIRNANDQILAVVMGNSGKKIADLIAQCCNRLGQDIIDSISRATAPLPDDDSGFEISVNFTQLDA